VTKITGAAYSCSKIIQDANTIFCAEPSEGVCEGLYKEYYERWGCAVAASGSCSTSLFVRFITTPCIKDMYNPEACATTGEWASYNIRACQ